LGTLPPEALLPQARPEAVGRHVRSRASGAEAPKQSLGARPTHPPEALPPQARPEAVGRRVRSRASGAEAPKQSLGARHASAGSPASSGLSRSCRTARSKQSFRGRGAQAELGCQKSRASRIWAPKQSLGARPSVPGSSGSSGARPSSASLRPAGRWRPAQSKQSFGDGGAQAELGCQEKDDGDGRTVNTRHSPASASLLDFLAFLAPWRSISIRAGNAKPAAPRGRGGSAPAQATGIRSS
jgi:hypothetical protein